MRTQSATIKGLRSQDGALEPKFLKPTTEIPNQVRDDRKREPNPVVMLNSFQHLVKIFSAFGRHTFHSRTRDRVFRSNLNKNGVSLIELLVALVICGIVVAGSYRFFITQNKAYTVQDQVIEAQQNVRLAMEILMRDLRMAGYDDDSMNSTITIINPIVAPLRDDSITFSYEYYDKTTSQYQKHTVAYWREMNPPRLIRQLTINEVAGSPDVLLENVDDFELTYGISTNGNGDMTQWVPAEKVEKNKVIAVHVVLSATPTPINPDARTVSPRTLASAVTLRNLSMVR